MEWITWIGDNWEVLFQIVTSVVGAFALLATLTPNETDNKVMDIVVKAVNFIGANFGKAKNDPNV